ncbi:hypothetical protein [Micromonospora sp. NPDC047730]|uniref:hypothetical protein n=1 Tax=Micromonospora sp. NPDC047730 TaxID=3364253 RepID=UPI00371EE301
MSQWTASDSTSCWTGNMYRRSRHATASKEALQTAANNNKVNDPTLTYIAPGGLPQDPGLTAESSAGPKKTDEENEGTTCVRC